MTNDTAKLRAPASAAVAATDTAGWATLAIGVAGSAAMVASAVLMGIQLPVIVTIYVATLIAVALLLRFDLRTGRDASANCLALVAAIAVGPIGCLGAGLLSVFLSRRRSDTELLANWYERISLATNEDPITRLCEDVGVGRSMSLHDKPPVSYHATVCDGSLSDRQAVLGLIARRFHLDYLPILRTALVSSQPVIRVQAAAVAAHIRPTLADEFRDCLAAVPRAATSPVDSLALLRRMELALGSGLLDAGDERTGRALLDRLGDVVLSGFRREASPALMRAIAASQGAEATFERLLMARGRFADLRMLRNSLRVLKSRHRARVRRLLSSTASAGAAA